MLPGELLPSLCSSYAQLCHEKLQGHFRLQRVLTWKYLDCSSRQLKLLCSLHERYRKHGLLTGDWTAHQLSEDGALRSERLKYCELPTSPKQMRSYACQTKFSILVDTFNFNLLVPKYLVLHEDVIFPSSCVLQNLTNVNLFYWDEQNQRYPKEINSDFWKLFEYDWQTRCEVTQSKKYCIQ